MNEEGTPEPARAAGESSDEKLATTSPSSRARPPRAMKEQAREMVRVYRKEFTRNWVLFKESKIGVVGLGIIIAFVSMAIFAPIIPIASERHPTQWRGPLGDYTELKPYWYAEGGSRTYIKDSDPFGQWGTNLTPSAALLEGRQSSPNAILAVQGSDQGLFGIVPGGQCISGQRPINPCPANNPIRSPYVVGGIGQVVGTPIVNTRLDRGLTSNASSMVNHRIYANTAEGQLYSFRIDYDFGIQPPLPIAIRHAGSGNLVQKYDAGAPIRAAPVFDYLATQKNSSADCSLSSLPGDVCFSGVYIVTEKEVHRVRDEYVVLNGTGTWRWSKIWNLSYEDEKFKVQSDPLFAPHISNVSGSQRAVSMIVMTGSDGKLHAYRNNNSNSSAVVGEKAWTWPSDLNDHCLFGVPKSNPLLNPQASPRSIPRGLTGEWRDPTHAIYVSGMRGHIFAIRPDGTCIRTYDTHSDAPLWTPHVVESGEYLDVGSEDHNIYEFTAEGTVHAAPKVAPGTLVWSNRTTGPVRAEPFSSTALSYQAGSGVIVPSMDSTVYIMVADREHGKGIVQLRIEMGEGAEMLTPLFFRAGLQPADEVVLISTKDGRMGLFKAIGKYLAPLPPGCYKSGTCYLMGTDFLGRDVFSQLVWGSQLALMIGFLAAFFSISIGLIVGLVAGYFGGKTDSVLMRFTDVVLVLPGLPFLIVLASVLGTNLFNLVLVIALIGWPGTARIIRAEVLSLKERPYIDAARITGASHARIMFKHISPNVFPLVFLFLTFAVSGAIIAEASLSFIGLGDTNRMSWGIMLYYAQYTGNALTAWWWLLPPGIAITMISLGFFLVGRAFEQIINPRLRKR